MIKTTKNNNKMEVIKIDLNALKKPNWSEKELKNATLATDFVQNLMNNHDFDYVLKHFGNSEYKQYNRNIPDGFNALVEYVRGFAKRFPDYTYDVKQIYVDGDYVIFKSHATINKKHRGNDKKGLNITDTWRIKDGKIVEHWDSIQPIDGFMRFYIWLTGGKIANNNGVF